MANFIAIHLLYSMIIISATVTTTPGRRGAEASVLTLQPFRGAKHLAQDDSQEEVMLVIEFRFFLCLNLSALQETWVRC